MEEEFDYGGGEAGGEAEDFEAPPTEESPNDEGFEAIPEIAQQQQHPNLQRHASSDAPMPVPPPSEATNKWKVDNEKKIKQKDAEFAKVKAELTKKAEATLQKLRTERANKIAKSAQANREAQAKQQAASAKSAPGAAISWQKLSHLVDLDKETTDRESMRLLFKSKVAESKA